MASSRPGLGHHLLWMAFKPGQLLYQNIEGVGVLSRLRLFFMDRRDSPNNHQPPRFRRWVVEAETLKCDGMSVGHIRRVTLIHSYEGIRPLYHRKSDLARFDTASSLIVKSFKVFPKVEYIPATRMWQIASDEHLTISDEDTLLCDPWIQGYSLVNKSWDIFWSTVLRRWSSTQML